MQAPIRSCLKRSSQRPAQHAVHFPPSQALCNTFATHSPTVYDRSPIVVSQNTCALPERNGRTYVLDEQAALQAAASRAPPPSSSRSYHPRAMTDDRRAGFAPLPQLIPDISSSESDESDGFLPSPSIPFGLPASHYYSYGSHGLPTKYEWDSADYSASDLSGDINALSFLPYPPSPNAHDDKSRRRRSRQHDSSLDLDRIRSANNSNDSSSSLEEHRFVPPPPKKRSCSRRKEYLNKLSSTGTGGLCASFSNMGLDDGCLGGF
ncbi:hypothetical protein FA15DRAFT_386662 [Coprinopsis marcescibilis]|uniref:Uncharacterized protein n=1 Tax=Coprinopsis marcescibilis TaxID=230819 RepID=A0A5C3L9G3_COPMA|nr:hypothetical protein FA15DRAFT_386662 [Coprinopsis marcescibilis]